MTVQLICGDCLAIMPTLPAASADMILADLPYGTTACSWDVVIPFEPLWAQYRRIIKPRGAIVLFGSQPFTSLLVMSNLEWFKYEWIWEKTGASGFVHAKNKPMKAHENILVFSNGTTVHACQSVDRMTYNPQMEAGEPYKKTCRGLGQKHLHAPSAANLAMIGTTAMNDGTRYPRSVIVFSGLRQGVLHTTQKPVALLEYLIRTYTNEGETVLDNTMGSGSTGVACVNTGRHFVGIELREDYCAIAERRIAEAQQQPALLAAR